MSMLKTFQCRVLISTDLVSVHFVFNCGSNLQLGLLFQSYQISGGGVHQGWQILIWIKTILYLPHEEKLSLSVDIKKSCSLFSSSLAMRIVVPGSWLWHLCSLGNILNYNCFSSPRSKMGTCEGRGCWCEWLANCVSFWLPVLHTPKELRRF